MKAISGKYYGEIVIHGDYIVEEEISVKVDNLNKNVVSITFECLSEIFKLTGVLNVEENLIHIYVMDRFTEKYHLQGFGLKDFNKSGVHGYINRDTNSMTLQVVMNQFNEQAIKISFEGVLIDN